MSAHIGGFSGRYRLITTVGLLSVSAVCISAAVIVYFNSVVRNETAIRFGTSLELAAVLLTPYMISAVVAAITAIGIIAIWPNLRSVGPGQHILDRLRGLRAGDLSSTVSLSAENQLSEIAVALNEAVDSLNNQVARLKMVNRRQWNILCEIRTAAENDNCSDVLRGVETMEKNWETVATIETELCT
jgi:hypothetical protein